MCDALKPAAARTRRERACIESGDTWQTLPLITALKKLCNTPDLLVPMLNRAGTDNSLPATVRELYASQNFSSKRPYNEGWSSKMQFLDRLLRALRTVREKVVIVSNYTQSLDVIGGLCASRKTSYFQLDGA